MCILLSTSVIPALATDGMPTSTVSAGKSAANSGQSLGNLPQEDITTTLEPEVSTAPTPEASATSSPETAATPTPETPAPANPETAATPQPEATLAPTPVPPEGTPAPELTPIPEVSPEPALRDTALGDANGDGYNDKDVAVINAMIDNNGLQAEKDAPTSWSEDLVYWTNEPIKRIRRLEVDSKGLYGELDISSLDALQVLHCNSNSLTNILLGEITGITELYFGGNYLTSFDATQLKNLEHLMAGANQLYTLKVNGLPKLKELRAYKNNLSEIELKGMEALESLELHDNSAMQSLDLSGAPNLQDYRFLVGDTTHLRELVTTEGFKVTVSGLATGRKWISRYNISERTVTVKAEPKSGYAFVSWDGALPADSPEASLVVDGNKTATASFRQASAPSETGLYHEGDRKLLEDMLTSQGLMGKDGIDAKYPSTWPVVWSNDKENKRAIKLNLQGKGLSGALDFTGLSALTVLDCSDNRITSLNTTNLKSLTEVSCSNNPIAQMQFQGCSALNRLICANAALTSLDFTGMTTLSGATLSGNPLKTLTTGKGFVFTLDQAEGGKASIFTYSLDQAGQEEIRTSFSPSQLYKLDGWTGNYTVTSGYPLSAIYKINSNMTVRPNVTRLSAPVYSEQDMKDILSIYEQYGIPDSYLFDMEYPESFYCEWKKVDGSDTLRATSFPMVQAGLQGDVVVKGLSELRTFTVQGAVTSLKLENSSRLENLVLYGSGSAMKELDLTGMSALKNVKVLGEFSVRKVTLPGGEIVQVGIPKNNREEMCGIVLTELSLKNKSGSFKCFSKDTSPYDVYIFKGWYDDKGSYLTGNANYWFDLKKGNLKLLANVGRTLNVSPPDPSAENIIGITQDAVFAVGSKINFTCTPAEAYPDPLQQDMRYYPLNWKVEGGPSGNFKEGLSQSISTQGMESGTYTLTIGFRTETFLLDEWKYGSTGDVGSKTVSLQFQLSAPVPTPTPEAPPAPADKIKLGIPKLVKSNYIETGAAIAPQFTGFDAALMTMDVASGIKSGEYKTTIQIKDSSKYQWDSKTNPDGGWQYTWYIIENKPQDKVTEGNTGITAEGVEGTTFAPGTELTVKEKPKAELAKYQDAVNKIDKTQVLLNLFDISLVLEGQTIQPNGKVKLRLPLTAEQQAMKNLRAVYIDDAGAATFLESSVNGRYLEVITDHFSLYGIVANAQNSTPAPTATAAPTGAPTEKPAGPTTGDTDNTGLLLVILLLSAGAAAGCIAINRRRVKKKG